MDPSRRLILLALCGLALPYAAQSAPAQDEYRFDFGPADSPVAAGWRQLTPGEVYDARRGYGWVQLPEEGFSRDVHWPSELPANDAAMRELPLDPLTRDGVASANAITLRVDVPNGDYEVRAWIGDYVMPATRQVVTVNQQRLAYDVTTGTGSIWGQILHPATQPVRGVFTVTDGALRVTYDTLEKSARNRVRAVGVEIRRFVRGPVLLMGTKLSWVDETNPVAATVCELINAGKFEEARRRIDAVPDDGKQRYDKACLWEALAGTLAQTDLSVSLALADRALALLRESIPSVDAVAVAGRRQILTDFRNACAYYCMMSYKRFAVETKKNRWRRFREAANWATLVLPNEPLYWQAQLMAARLNLNMGIEGNPAEGEAGKPIIERLLRQFPDNRIVRLYASKCLGQPELIDEWRFRLGGTAGPAPELPPPLKQYLLADPRAPEWAVLQRGLLASVIEIVNYWLAVRQVESGEIGGGFNDDVEVLRRWGAVALALDLPALDAGIAKLADGLWSSSGDLRAHGYPGDLGDVEHNAEDVSDTQPLAMALNYGEPRFVERCLLTSSHIERRWTGLTAKNRRHFRSYYFSWDQIDSAPERAFDVQLSARAVKPALWAAWYTHEPTLLRVLEEWSEAWVAVAMESSGGKPPGVFPAGVHYPENAVSTPWYFVPAYKSLSKTGMYDELMWEHLLGMWAITGKERYLEPMHASLGVVQQAGDGPEGSAAWAGTQLHAPIYGRIATWRLMTGDRRHDAFLVGNGPAYVRTLLGARDEPGVLEALRVATLSNAQHFELLTSEVLFTDRIFMRGHEELAAMFGGGVGISQFPAHAVRWENVGGELAVWVQEATMNHFRARAYSFASTEKTCAMQHWRLRPGRYRLDVRPNESGASVFSSRVVDLRHRGDSVPLELPAGREVIVELTQLETLPWNPAKLPDLAAATGPSSRGTDQITWEIYNLGCVSAKNVAVQLRANGRPVETQTIAEVPPVHDYKIGSVKALFGYPGSTEGLSLVIDPDERIEEITKRNNRSERRK